MKKLMLIMTLLLSDVLNAQNVFDKTAVRVMPSSELTITGETNINSFKCIFDTSFLNDREEIRFSTGKDLIKFSGAVLTLETRGFDCGSKAINRDFRDLIKADKYPQLFLELSEVKLKSRTNGVAKICITIAGRQKVYDVPVEIINGELSRFIGQLSLNINDYGLEPPKKLFGMIVVKDEIDIIFDLKIKLHK